MFKQSLKILMLGLVIMQSSPIMAAEKKETTKMSKVARAIAGIFGITLGTAYAAVSGISAVAGVYALTGAKEFINIAAERAKLGAKNGFTIPFVDMPLGDHAEIERQRKYLLSLSPSVATGCFIVAAITAAGAYACWKTAIELANENAQEAAADNATQNSVTA